jgi:hypothetical protein
VTEKKGQPKEYDDYSDNSKDVNHTGSIIITKKTDPNPDDKQFKKALLGNRTEVPCSSAEKYMVNKIIKPFTSTHKCNCCRKIMCSYLCSVSKMEGEFLCYHCSFLNKETKLSSFLNPKEREKCIQCNKRCGWFLFGNKIRPNPIHSICLQCLKDNKHYPGPVWKKYSLLLVRELSKKLV